jgi:single-stranded DNA-binding protein
VVFFNRLASIVAEYVQPGMQLYVCGSLKTSKWEKDGITRYTTKIVGNELQMLGSDHQQTAPSGVMSLVDPKEVSRWNNNDSTGGWDLDLGDVPF